MKIVKKIFSTYFQVRSSRGPSPKESLLAVLGGVRRQRLINAARYRGESGGGTADEGERERER